MRRKRRVGIIALACSAMLLAAASGARADGSGGQIVVTPGDQTGAFELPSVGVGVASPGGTGSSGSAVGSGQASPAGSQASAENPQDPGPGFQCMYSYVPPRV